jgi:hypothetical protein
MRFGLRRADDGGLRLVREAVHELAPSLFGRDEHDPRAARAAELLVERLGDVLAVLLDEVLDVPLVARLRPAALVMASGLLLAAVDDLLEPSVP